MGPAALAISGTSIVVALVALILMGREMGRRQDADRELQNLSAELASKAAHLTAEHERSRRFMRAVIENMQEAVLVSRAGHIAFANARCVGLLGAGSMGDVIGKATIECFAQEFRPAVERTIADLTASGEPVPPREEKIRRPDGTTVDVELSAAMYRSDEDDAIVVILHDITARKAAELQFRHAQKMEAIGNLTGGMAHDFNNLLGIVIGNLDLLADGFQTDPIARELMEEAMAGATRGADLTRRLLAFARQQPLAPQQTDVNVLVGNIVKLLSRTLGEQVEISLELGRDIWPVEVDPTQLESAIANLATNARDAMPRGGRLTIVTDNRHLDADYANRHGDLTPGDYAMVEISDTGTGMPPDMLERVFEPFFTTKAPGKGTGLGLAMVFGFMKQSGGHINVYSELGHGTTFRLYLPRTGVAPVAAAVADAAAAPARGETILVVEDNESVRRVAVRQLESLGYRVIEADSGAAAVAALDTAAVDLLFTDVVMPGGISGLDLAGEVRKRLPGVKVLLTSGFPGANLNGGRGLMSGLRLLSKPYRKEELARAVREVFEA